LVWQLFVGFFFKIKFSMRVLIFDFVEILKIANDDG
jgi:hypothetical protein